MKIVGERVQVHVDLDLIASVDEAQHELKEKHMKDFRSVSKDVTESFQTHLIHQSAARLCLKSAALYDSNFSYEVRLSQQYFKQYNTSETRFLEITYLVEVVCLATVD